MKLTFLGTRGNIEARNPLHNRHSSLLIAHERKHVMIDCGEDWLARVRPLSPDAIVITHAHPDHASGLKNGADSPVWATQETWSAIDSYDIADRRVGTPREPFDIAGMLFEAFPVVHSIRAPAVGYRVRAGTGQFFYVPDVVEICDRQEALAGVQLYVGDGATLTRPIVRRSEGQLIGHTSVRTQLAWCGDAGVPRAIFTHCGSQILRGDRGTIDERVDDMGSQLGVLATVACDGLQMWVR